MAYKVNAISFNTRQMAKPELFTKDTMLRKCTPCPKDAEHVFKGFQMSRSSVTFLNFLDKITPYLNRHSNIKRACLYIGEKLVRFTNNI